MIASLAALALGAAVALDPGPEARASAADPPKDVFGDFSIWVSPQPVRRNARTLVMVQVPNPAWLSRGVDMRQSGAFIRFRGRTYRYPISFGLPTGTRVQGTFRPNWSSRERPMASGHYVRVVLNTGHDAQVPIRVE